MELIIHAGDFIFPGIIDEFRISESILASQINGSPR